MSEQADVLYCQNQDMVAVTPAPGGRLDKLVNWFLPFPPHKEQPQVWIFGDLLVYAHREGDSITEYFHLRGVLSGSNEDARLFFDLCRELGLEMRYDSSLTVPCSNGPRCLNRAAWLWDFTRREYERVRWDRPPTREELVKLLAETADATVLQSPA